MPANRTKIGRIHISPMIRSAVRECRAHIVAISTFSFFVNLLYLAPAIYMLQVYDRVVPTGGLATLTFLTLALGIALISLSSLDSIRLRLLIRGSLRLDAICVPVLTRHCIKSGVAGSQALRDFDTIRSTIATPTGAAMFDVPWFPIFVLVAFLLHFWIGMLAIVAAVAMLALAWANQRVTRPGMEEASRSSVAAHAWIQSAAAHSEVVTALGMATRLVDRGIRMRSSAVTALAEAQFAGSRFTVSSRFLRLFVQSASLGLGAVLAVEGSISAGAIIAASIVVGRALQPVDALIAGWSPLMAARAALARLQASNALDQTDVQERTRLPAPEGRVSLVQVGLRAGDGRPILFGVSLEIEPGQVLAVIGPSGSGKTSLAKVIVGAVQPTVGTVRLDSARLTDWDQADLGRYIGYMPQQPSLLDGSIRDNICRFEKSGDPDEIDAEVVAAAKLAGAHECILHLPEGYETSVGPIVTGLSGGQAQTIALARALYRQPKVIVLDEPNSWLDAEGDAALARAVKSVRSHGSAVVIAAHRRSILDYADRILVLDSGRPRLLGDTTKIIPQLCASAKSETAA